jgi:hypothetical protein
MKIFDVPHLEAHAKVNLLVYVMGVTHIASPIT